MFHQACGQTISIVWASATIKQPGFGVRKEKKFSGIAHHY